ncbi:MAG: TldD/PmbA family protein [Thermodesulfobacteriota bacterium]
MREETLKNHSFEKAVDILRGCLAGAGGEYELFFMDEDGISAESKGGAVDSLKVKRGHGVGIRVILEGRVGFAYSSLLESEALRETVKKAVSLSALTESDAFMDIPGGRDQPLEAPTGIYDDSYAPDLTEEVIERAALVEEGARAFSKEVARVRNASYQERRISTRLINSKGVDVQESATFYTGHVTAVAQRGDEAQMGWDMGLGHLREKVDPYKTGASAANRAVRMLGARTIKTEVLPAVLENTVVSELLGALSSSFLGDNLFKGKSMLQDTCGEKVFSGLVNIIDDGSMSGGWSTSSFDGEGLPMQETSLVADGVVQGYLYDSYWAARMKTVSTGNAVRGGYMGSPGVGVTNLYMEAAPGAVSIEDLFHEAGRGLFITELMGVHTINPVTGDFSLGASGMWIEDGALQYPVRGLAISGNLLRVFGAVAALGSDMRFFGPIGAPGILINELEASGAK